MTEAEYMRKTYGALPTWMYVRSATSIVTVYESNSQRILCECIDGVSRTYTFDKEVPK